MISIKHTISLMVCLLVSGCVSIPAPETPGKSITDQTFGRYHENLESNLILITMTSEYHAFLTDRKPAPITANVPPRYAQFLDKLQSDYGLNRVANWPLAAINIFCVVFEVNDVDDRSSLVASLEQEPGVETAQLVNSFATQAQPYNDPYLPLQHAVHSIQLLRSHQWSSGKGVRVAVIDTGMDSAHIELESRTELTRNFVDSDEAQFRSDRHGTAVGGVIAANAGNQTGMVGIAPDATLLALKACWHPSNDAPEALCNSLTLAKAINYSIEQAVDIINLSLTGPPDPVLERLVLEALSRNIAVVGAKPTHNRTAFPVSIPGTIAVSMPDNESGTLTAPGRRVLSIRPDTEYDFFDGSSFSTAHITGLAALVRSISPNLTPDGLQNLLQTTSDESTGAVNACRAVALIMLAAEGRTPKTDCGTG